MTAGSGGAAIFHHHHHWVRKFLPKSWLTSFPVPPSWNQDGGATSNVWRTSELLWNPQKGVVLVQKHPADLWSYFFLLFEKHLMVSLPSHSWNGVWFDSKPTSTPLWKFCAMIKWFFRVCFTVEVSMTYNSVTFHVEFPGKFFATVWTLKYFDVYSVESRYHLSLRYY